MRENNEVAEGPAGEEDVCEVGEDAAALESELLHDSGMKRFVEKVYRVRLDREFGAFEKVKILHSCGIGQVDQDTNPLPLPGCEGAPQKGG